MKELVSILKNTRQHLMNGVSHMIPVVVGGGVLMALAVLFTGKGAAPDAGWQGGMWNIGNYALGMMVPVLAMYISASIADRPGLAPGLVAGLISKDINAGFLGAIVGGLLAGIIAQYLKKIPLPKSMKSLKSIMIIPILSILIVGIIMLYGIGTPIASVMVALESWLKGLQGGSMILLGAIAGLMIAFDLGGPVNKVAYSILMVAGAADGLYHLVGPVGIAICVPPIGAGVASLIFKKKFSQEERDAGVSAVAMGFCGITEGAISYTTNDPIRMIPINMISSAIAGALAGALGVGSKAAWGGLIVTPVTTKPLLYIVCILVGVAIYVALCAVFKKNYVEHEEVIEDVDISFE